MTTRSLQSRRGRLAALAVSAAGLALVFAGLASPPAQADDLSATGGCYGPNCVGLDPAGRCDGDAATVGQMWVDGAASLELRYSPSCKAAWARISMATGGRQVIRSAARAANDTWVTASVWNQDQPSQGIVNEAGDAQELTKWTAMVDGMQKVCSGGKVTWSIPSDSGYGASTNEEGSWTWGPCMNDGNSGDGGGGEGGWGW